MSVNMISRTCARNAHCTTLSHMIYITEICFWYTHLFMARMHILCKSPILVRNLSVVEIKDPIKHTCLFLNGNLNNDFPPSLHDLYRPLHSPCPSSTASGPLLTLRQLAMFTALLEVAPDVPGVSRDVTSKHRARELRKQLPSLK